MKHALPAWLSLALLAPLAAGCVAQATVTPPEVSANVDVNAQAGAVVDPNATVAATAAPSDDYQDTDPSALTDFHQSLDSHGTWVEDPTYGTVWVPAASEVGPTYTPYSTAGHWAYDANDDYVWVSDYDWGWAPYHYGRWVDIDGRGWSWIPGRVYRGAWVTWGADDGFGTVGWAPMPPEYVWRGGVAVGYTYAGPPLWNYVGRGDVFAPNVGSRVLAGPAAVAASGHVRVMTAGGLPGHSGGPSPQSLGLTPTQVPRVTAATSAGIMKAQNFGHASTAASLGGRPPTMTASSTLMPSGMRGGATTTPTAGQTRTMTPSNTQMPSGMAGATTTTAGTSTRPTDTPRATGQPGNHVVQTQPTTTTTPTTVPVQQKGRKRLPDPTPTPTPRAGGAGGGGHSGTGGGSGGGHGGTPHPR